MDESKLFGAEKTLADTVEMIKTAEIKDPCEFKYLKDSKQRELLGEAIEKVVDEVENIATAERNGKPKVIFLDRSARPLATYFINLWRKKFPDEPLPKISFINIGTELLSEKPSTVTTIINSGEVKEEIARIREEYSYLKEARDGSTVLIVDDVISSGFVKNMALRILREAFPSLKFKFRALTRAREKNERDTGVGSNKNPRLFDFTPEGMSSDFLITAAPWFDKRAGSDKVSLTSRKEDLYNGETGLLKEELNRAADEYWEQKAK